MQSRLYVCLFNVRSLFQKLTSFQSFVYSSQFNIFCICETWLSDFVYDHEILPCNYSIYHKDRMSRGGGVLVAVNNVFDSVCLPSPSDLEIITVKLGHDLVLCSSYVPPNSNDAYLSALLDHFSYLISSFSNCIFVGDFNFPDIDWSSLSASSSHSKSFCEFVFDSNLTQHVNHPTHFKGNILDLVLTSSSLTIENLSIESPPAILSSDHYVISFIPVCDVLPPTRYRPGYVFDHSKSDYHGMCSYLMDVDFSSCLQSFDVEYVWFCIKSIIYDAISLFTPKVDVKRSQTPKWYTPSIRHRSNCLKSLKKRFKHHPTPLLMKSGNPSAVHGYIRNFTKGSGIPQSVYLCDTCASTDSAKAMLFNQYFHSVYQPAQCGLLSPPGPFRSSQTLRDISVRESEVYQILLSLDTSKATGCDGISALLLKKCAIPLLQPLHHLFCLSLMQSYLPEEWRTHLIKPIPKSGSNSLVENYRPISLLCITSKILEKIVHNYIAEHLFSNISASQFGFLKGRSTLQQLPIFFNLLTNNVSRSM